MFGQNICLWFQTEYNARFLELSVYSFATPKHIYAIADMCKGLPLGNLTSQLLVNIYMNEFDQCIQTSLGMLSHGNSYKLSEAIES